MVNHPAPFLQWKDVIEINEYNHGPFSFHEKKIIPSEDRKRITELWEGVRCSRSMSGCEQLEWLTHAKIDAMMAENYQPPYDEPFYEEIRRYYGRPNKSEFWDQFQCYINSLEGDE